MYQYVFALAHRAEGACSITGTGSAPPGVAICSCNDGLRPVIFKLEATDQEAERSYPWYTEREKDP